MDMKQYEKICADLKSKGIEIYSHSKLETFENCPYSYYMTYVEGDRGIDNVYSFSGGKTHEAHELVYGKKENKEYMSKMFNELMDDLETFGITFPNEQIKNKWVGDMQHYVDNYKILDHDSCVIEEPFVFEIADGIWMRGFIDIQIKLNDEKIIIDWKTSSKFSGKKIDKAGKQLILYKIAKKDIDKVGWGMLKYVNFCFIQKNKKTKRKMCNRSTWVKECENYITKALLDVGLDEFEVEILFYESLLNNNINNLPKDIQDKFWLEDSFVWYDIEENKEQEYVSWVEDVVGRINSKNNLDDQDWEPIDITDRNSFFCGNLCNHRKKCKYYIDFLNGKESINDDDDWLS